VISSRSLCSEAGIIRPGDNHPDFTCVVTRNATRLTSGVEKVCETTDAAALHESDKVTSRRRPLTYYVASVRGQGKRCCVVNIQKKVELKGGGGGINKCDAIEVTRDAEIVQIKKLKCTIREGDMFFAILDASSDLYVYVL
jgi:hypothetical protein